MGGNELLDRQQPVLVERGDVAGQRWRDLEAGESLLGVVGVDDAQGQVERQVGDLGKGVGRIDREGGEDRKNSVVEHLAQMAAVVDVELIPRAKADALGVQRGQQSVDEDLVGAGDEFLDPIGDLGELLGGGHPVGGRLDDAGFDLVEQAGDTHLVELVEVLAEDGEKLCPFKHRNRGVGGQRQHPGIEVEPAEFPVVETRRRHRTHGTDAPPRCLRREVPKLQILWTVHLLFTSGAAKVHIAAVTYPSSHRTPAAAEPATVCRMSVPGWVCQMSLTPDQGPSLMTMNDNGGATVRTARGAVRSGPVETPAGAEEIPDIVTEAVFETKNLSVLYSGFRAVRDVNMTIRRGEITAFIGSSGCGKSTVLRCLNRMNDLVEGASVEGQVLYRGVDLYDPEVSPVEVRRRIGMVFQKPNPFPKSIWDNIAYGPRIAGVKKKQDLDDVVEKSLRRAALWDEVKDRLNTSAMGMSGGQQQRLCIARAIASEPEVLLMDEPCSALDPIATNRVEDLMRELRDDYTIVIVTHNMQQAARVSDTTAFFGVEVSAEGDRRTGLLVEFDETERIFSSPADERTENYITGRVG